MGLLFRGESGARELAPAIKLKSCRHNPSLPAFVCARQSAAEFNATGAEKLCVSRPAHSVYHTPLPQRTQITGLSLLFYGLATQSCLGSGTLRAAHCWAVIVPVSSSHEWGDVPAILEVRLVCRE